MAGCKPPTLIVELEEHFEKFTAFVEAVCVFLLLGTESREIEMVYFEYFNMIPCRA